MPSFRETLDILNQTSKNVGEAADTIAEIRKSNDERKALAMAPQLFADNPAAAARLKAAPPSIRAELLKQYIKDQQDVGKETKAKTPFPSDVTQFLAGKGGDAQALMNKYQDRDIQDSLNKAVVDQRNFAQKSNEAESKGQKRTMMSELAANKQYNQELGPSEQGINQANKIIGLIHAIKNADPNDPNTIKSTKLLRTELASAQNSLMTGKSATVHGMEEGKIQNIHTDTQDALNYMKNNPGNTIPEGILNQQLADMTALKEGISDIHATKFGSFIEGVPDDLQPKLRSRFQKMRDFGVKGLVNPYNEGGTSHSLGSTELTGKHADLVKEAAAIPDPNVRNKFIQGIAARKDQSLNDDTYNQMLMRIRAAKTGVAQAPVNAVQGNFNPSPSQPATGGVPPLSPTPLPTGQNMPIQPPQIPDNEDNTE